LAANFFDFEPPRPRRAKQFSATSAVSAVRLDSS
jgi:hypothetical protein